MSTKPQKTAADRPLTPKQDAFITHLIKNPTDSAANAARIAGYSPKTARVIAAENLSKPNIVSKLGRYSNLFESTIVGTVRDFKKSEKLGERTLAANLAMWGHDKVHGKAVQQSTSVNLNFTGHVQDKGNTYGL